MTLLRKAAERYAKETGTPLTVVGATRPVLFLDFDGVLNNSQERVCSPERADYLDPEKVDLVNQIVERTGCAVVASTSWRLLYKPTPRTALNELLGKRGARFKLDGVTPPRAEHDDRCGGQGHASECGRGHEIQEWIDHWKPRTIAGPIAIVDDGADMGHLLPRLVQTSDDVGLTQEHVERLVALLTETQTETP